MAKKSGVKVAVAVTEKKSSAGTKLAEQKVVAQVKQGAAGKKIYSPKVKIAVHLKRV